MIDSASSLYFDPILVKPVDTSHNLVMFLTSKVVLVAMMAINTLAKPLVTKGMTILDTRWTKYMQTTDLTIDVFTDAACTQRDETQAIGPIVYNQNNTVSAYS